MDDKQFAACAFLDHIRANRSSIGELLQLDPVSIRQFAAENGVELTPDECLGLLNVLKHGYDMVGGSDGWKDFVFDN